MDIQALFTEALDDKFGKNKKSASLTPPCSLVITFRNINMINEFQELISPVQTLDRRDNLLITFFPSHADAQAKANEISSLLSSFNQKVIAQPFSPNWLDEYLSIKDYGVGVVMADHSLSSEDKIPEYMKLRQKHKTKDLVYDKQKAEAKRQVLNYERLDFRKDLSDYLSANWEGYGDYFDVILTGIMQALHNTAKGRHHFDNYPAQTILSAMEDKAEHLADNDNQNTEAAFGAVTERMRLMRQFECLSDSNTRNEMQEMATRNIKTLIEGVAPKFAPKGYAVMLEDEDAYAPQQTPFKGVDVSFNSMHDFTSLLHPDNLRYSQLEYGNSVIQSAAWGITRYFLFLMELKQEALFESLLREHSKVMDTKPFFDHLMAIAEESRPL